MIQALSIQSTLTIPQDTPLASKQARLRSGCQFEEITANAAGQAPELAPSLSSSAPFFLPLDPLSKALRSYNNNNESEKK